METLKVEKYENKGKKNEVKMSYEITKQNPPHLQANIRDQEDGVNQSSYLNLLAKILKFEKKIKRIERENNEFQENIQLSENNIIEMNLKLKRFVREVRKLERKLNVLEEKIERKKRKIAFLRAKGLIEKKARLDRIESEQEIKDEMAKKFEKMKNKLLLVGLNNSTPKILTHDNTTILTTATTTKSSLVEQSSRVRMIVTHSNGTKILGKLNKNNSIEIDLPNDMSGSMIRKLIVQRKIINNLKGHNSSIVRQKAVSV